MKENQRTKKKLQREIKRNREREKEEYRKSPAAKEIIFHLNFLLCTRLNKIIPSSALSGQCEMNVCLLVSDLAFYTQRIRVFRITGNLILSK